MPDQGSRRPLGVLRFPGRALAALAHERCLVRTTNPIESTFATVWHRTIRTKGCRTANRLTYGPRLRRQPELQRAAEGKGQFHRTVIGIS
jgi:hypothetical protein